MPPPGPPGSVPQGPQPGQPVPPYGQPGYPAPQPGYPAPQPAPAKKSSSTWIVLVIVGVLLLCVLPAGCLGLAAIGRNATTTVAASGAGRSKSDPAPIGTEVTPAKDWTVKVDKADLDADAELKKINPLNSPSKGMQFVLVRITVKNSASTAQAPFMNMKLSLLRPGGAATDDSFCGEVPDRFSTTAEIQPGGTLTGDLCYEVPSADAEGSVLLAEPVLTLDEMKDQRFLALK